MSSISILSYFILTLAIGYAFILPAFEDISTLLDEKQKYDESLTTVSNIENKKDELLLEFDKISVADKKNMETILPNSFDFVKLISYIDAVAARYDISIKNISSKELDSSVGTSVADAQPSKPYSSGIIGFSFEASYDTFNKFMKELEESLRVLDIRSVKIQTGEKGAYLYNVEFETYWLK